MHFYSIFMGNNRSGGREFFYYISKFGALIKVRLVSLIRRSDLARIKVVKIVKTITFPLAIASVSINPYLIKSFKKQKTVKLQYSRDLVRGFDVIVIRY